MTLVDVFIELNIPFHVGGTHKHNREGWLNCDCPYCGRDSHKYHLGFNLSVGYGSCWQCGPKRLLDSLHEISNEHWSVLKELLGRIDFALPLHLGNGSLRSSKLVLPNGVGPMLKQHKNYLRRRGFTDIDNLIRLWGLRGIGLTAPPFHWRIYLPVYYQGREVSWTTRSIGTTTLRYISAKPSQEAVRLKTLLFGEDLVRHSIIVCEGPMDAIKIGPGAVATMGLVYTQVQVNKIARYPLRVICFDNEIEAQKRAKQLCNSLSCFMGKTINVCLSSKDAGSASDKEIKKLRKSFLE